MLTKYPNGIAAFPVVGANYIDAFAGSRENVYFVDGDKGSDGSDGKSPESAMATIQAAVTAAAARNATYDCGSVIYIKALGMDAGDTDPTSYTENIVIPADGGANMVLCGVSLNRAQGGLPQLKVGDTTTQALLTVRAPGVTIMNLGFNGVGATGGGILLDDDGSTKTAFGTSILNCHFKNCVGTTATNAATGGAIQWASTGGAWQVLIKGNRFYKNVGDIVMKGTTGSVPQDVVIEDNVFSGPAANVDCNIYVANDGINGLIIRNNCFTAIPAIGSGTNHQFLRLTSSVGILSGNTFAALTCEGGSQRTFGASGDELVPTTVFMAANYGEVITGTGAGLETGEIFRT